MARYKEIHWQIQSTSQFEFVTRETVEFEFLNFDWLTQISPPSRISNFILLTISNFMFSGTGCWTWHCLPSINLRLTMKKFGYPAGMKKIKLKKVKEINQKQLNFNLQNEDSRTSCNVKVGGVDIEGMMTLSKVGALV